MGSQTWGWGSRHGDRILDIEWGSRQGVGYQTWGWGSRHGMMGYQTNDGVPVRGGVTAFMSHQSAILHSLIYVHLEQKVMIAK